MGTKEEMNKQLADGGEGSFPTQREGKENDSTTRKRKVGRLAEDRILLKRLLPLRRPN